MICLNMIVNCPVNFDNVENAKLIFCPDITSLTVKSVRHNTASVVMDYVEIPREILELHKELELLTYIMFVKKIPS